MLELARELLPLLRDGVAVAAVTVTGVARSAPRGVGATMAVTADGRVIGSISGGCVESDAIMLAHAALATGGAHRARFGFTDESAHAAGLACGGTVDVVAYAVPSDETVTAALQGARDGRAVSLTLVMSGRDAGSLRDPEDVESALDAAELPAWREARLLRENRMLTSAYDGSDVLLLSTAAPPHIVIAGAGEHAAALCRVAAAAGFVVTVVDPWETLVTRERFPTADRLEVALPHDYLATLGPDELDARGAVCVLTHDERLDVPALAAALRLPVGFVGAMGARSTVARRLDLLREFGVSEVDLARIHSPLGLDLGGSDPAETAVSVLAEIIASRHGGTGLPLTDLDGPLHRRTAGDHSAPTVAAQACGIPNQTPTGTA